MNDKTVIIFSFPRKVMLDMSLAEKMGLIQDEFRDLPGVQIFSVVGGTADKIVTMLEKDPEEESGLVLHAMRELALMDNDKEFNDSIIAALEGFVSYGHSGGSASVAIPLLNDLLQYKNITPLTNDPFEWMQIVGTGANDSEGCWQNVRNPEAFSNDNGKTYYLLSEGASESNPEPKHESAEMDISTKSKG